MMNRLLLKSRARVIGPAVATAIYGSAAAAGPEATPTPGDGNQKGDDNRSSRKYVDVAIDAAKIAKETATSLESTRTEIETSSSKEERVKLLRKARQQLEKVRGQADRTRSANTRALRFLSSAFELERLEEVSQRAKSSRERANASRKQIGVRGRELEDRFQEREAKREERYLLGGSTRQAGRADAAKLDSEIKTLDAEIRRLQEALDNQVAEVETADNEAAEAEARAIELRTLVMKEVAEESRLSDEVRRAVEDAQAAEQEAENTYAQAARLVDERDRQEGAEDSLCGPTGNGARPVCFYYGLFTAALSRVTVTGEDGTGSGNPFWGGRSARQIGAVAVPTAGARYVPPILPFVSIDGGVFSAFVSPKLQSNDPAGDSGTSDSCSRNGSEFEKKLPCQGNAVLNPYAVGYLGLTVGRKNLAFFTLMPMTIGLGSLGDSKSLKAFYGWSLGVVQLNGVLP